MQLGFNFSAEISITQSQLWTEFGSGSGSGQRLTDFGENKETSIAEAHCLTSLTFIRDKLLPWIYRLQLEDKSS